MNPRGVFAVFLVLGLAWTGIWTWVMLNSGRAIPYADVAPRVTRLRRRLVWPFVGAAAVVFVVSLNWVAYPVARASRLGPPQVSVEVAGVQWAWNLGATEVPRGLPVEFRVTAQDVNHGFGIYDPDGRLVAQVQAMPRYTNRLITVLRRPGTYTVRCLEYCGVAHHAMVASIATVEPTAASGGGGR